MYIRSSIVTQFNFREPIEINFLYRQVLCPQIIGITILILTTIPVYDDN